MIQLIINNLPASLNKDETLKLQHENPFTTENGEYTYEITLPMDSVNQKIFGHINRHDVAQKKITFPAMLYSGMTLLLYGDAILTSVTESEIGIQLVGNSSATNFTYDDIYIDEMNLEEQLLDDELFYLTVYNKSAGALMCERFYRYDKNSNTLTLMFGTGETQRADSRPYYPSRSYMLATVMNTVLRSMQYTILENALANTLFYDIVVVNASYSRTKKTFSDSLPHWTVKEFFINLGQLMGVSFIFDSKNKTVNILSQKKFALANVVHLDQVVDEFECSMDNEDESNITSDIFEYDLQDEQQKQYEQIDQNLYSTILLASDLNEAYTFIDAMGTEKYTYAAMINNVIYAGKENASAPYGFYLRPIDNLRASGIVKQEPNVTLKFAPVHYTTASVNISEVAANRASVVIGTQNGVLVPAVEGNEYLPSSNVVIRPDTSENNNIIATIESEKTDNSYKPDQFHIALLNDYALQSFPVSFTPIDTEDAIERTVFDYPLPYVINNSEYLWYINALGVLYANPNRKKSLSLQSIVGEETIGTLLRDNHLNYKKSVTYKKQFIFRNGIPDVRAKFVIRGKTYICNKLTFEVDNNGIIPLMEGEFYEY